MITPALIIWIIAGIFINMLIGAIAWVLVDNDGRYYAWYKDGCDKMPFLAPMLVLNLWPAVFWVMREDRAQPPAPK